MAGSRWGDKRIGVQLIGAGLLGGPLLGLVMSLQGRSGADFVWLTLTSIGAVVLGAWLLVRGPGRS